MHAKPGLRVEFVHSDHLFRLGDLGRYVAQPRFGDAHMAYRLAQISTLSLACFAFAASAAVAQDARSQQLENETEVAERHQPSLLSLPEFGM